jgi:hypothetical protein
VDLVAKEPNTSRGLGAKIARHKRYANHYRVLQGSKCKTTELLLLPLTDRELGQPKSPASWASRSSTGLGKEGGSRGYVRGTLTAVGDTRSSPESEATGTAAGSSSPRCGASPVRLR